MNGISLFDSRPNNLALEILLSVVVETFLNSIYKLLKTIEGLTKHVWPSGLRRWF